MSKPNNTLNKFKFNQAGGTSVTKEIIPHRLTDGTNLAELPPLNKDKYLAVSDSAMNIPAVPSTNGDYVLLCRVENGQVVFGWFAVKYEYGQLVTSDNLDFYSYDEDEETNVAFNVIDKIS